MNFSTSSFRRYVSQLLAILFALGLVALLGTELLVRRLVEPSDQLPAHLRLFHAARSSDVGFGDSHMACGFNPLDQMTNLAFPGENIDNLRYKVLVYFKRVAPGRIVVQADAHMFARYRTGNDPGYNAAFDLPAEDRTKYSPRVLSNYHRPKLFAYWNVLFRKGGFDSRLKLQANGWTECAGKWIDRSLVERGTQARERAALHVPAEDFATGNLASAYRDALAALRRTGARLCLVEFPVSDEYRAAIAGPLYQEARDWFGSTATEFGARYLAHAARYSAQPEYFSDMDHLNPTGAAAFTQQILPECFG